MSSTDLASDYARRLVKRERAKTAGVESAMHNVSAEAGVGFWTLWGLWHRRRKRADGETIGKLRAALVRRLESEVRHLEHELQILRTIGVDPRDDTLAEAEAEADLARAKAALGLD